MALCDCYVSLHRSEGYGLTMAEAMACGEARDRDRLLREHGVHARGEQPASCRTASSPIPEGCDPYPPGAEWAEPDLDEAARLMRSVWENPEAARRLGRRAQEDILRRHTPRRTAEFITRRLDEIRVERSAKATDTRRAPLPGAPLLGTGRRYPTRLARRVLHRLLWPYLVEQQAFDTAVAEALRAHSAYATDVSAREQTADAFLVSGVPELSLTEQSVPEPAARRAGAEPR